jgi:hypothetical protein
MQRRKKRKRDKGAEALADGQEGALDAGAPGTQDEITASDLLAPLQVSSAALSCQLIANCCES